MILPPELILVLIFLGYGVLLFSLLLMVLALFNKVKFHFYKLDPKYRPGISLVVPACNEEIYIEDTIKTFLACDYPKKKKEMVIINDGSADRTGEIAERYARKVFDIPTGLTKTIPKRKDNIILINKEEGGRGKSYASNEGINFASKEIIMFIDADVRIHKESMKRVARHFRDKSVGAVAGYIGVDTKGSFLKKFTDFEFSVGQRLLRRGYNVMGVHYIVPGGCSAYRKSIIDEVGRYSHYSLAEDTDLTWKVLTSTKMKIHFDPSIIGVADEPETLEGLWKQRSRWARGNLQVTLKHRDKVFRPRYGMSQTVAYPFWISSIILPFAFLISSSAIVLGLFSPVDTTLIRRAGEILAVMFFGQYFLGVIFNRGRSWFQGLISPGLPVLSSLSSVMFWDSGLEGLLEFLKLSAFAAPIGAILGTWILVALPGSYISLQISKRFDKLGKFLQLFIFGYWMILIAAILDGYGKQILRKENIWEKTRKVADE